MTLKITTIDGPDCSGSPDGRGDGSDEPLALRLEGRITGDTATELRSTCAAALARGRTVVVHLAGVSFADPSGADALRDLERDGCLLLGCSDFLATLLRGGVPAERQAGGYAPDADEARLVQSLRAGAPAAFEALVRRQSGAMLAAARRILASEDDARDAVQEAFVSAFRAIAGFDGAARLSTWLHRIVVNASLMKLRSRRRRPEESIDELLPCFDENGDWASGMARQHSSAEAHVGARQEREMVRRCIARLPDSYRVVLVLRDIEDRDTGEVAEQLGVSPNAVKIRLHRARQALRALLEQERAADAPALRAAGVAIANPGRGLRRDTATA